MKLCPQCEFLYEDDQVFCDMDGESLVHDGRSEVFSDAAPAVIAPSPKHFRRRIIVVTMIAGVLLSALLSFVYYASSHSFDSDLASRSGKPEANLSQQNAAAHVDNSAPQAAAGPSQALPAKPSESPSASADEPAGQSESAAIQTTSQTTSKAKDNTSNANDSRLMISKQVPPLPQLNPLPRLLPPQRLSAAKPTATSAASRISGKQKSVNQTTTETSQKSLIVEVKPASRNATKRSKVGTFLKKTGRMLTKPFKR
jgi:hypothetical protein